MSINNKSNSLLLLLSILIVGAFFRFYDLNWDQNAHLHPDERFLTMVGNAMKIPGSFTDYMDPAKSTLNPANIGFNFYVYGIFPVTLNKIVAVILGTDNYNDFTIQGRLLSAVADLIIVISLFWVVYLAEKQYRLDPSAKFFASLLYAIFVLPIQLSHFFTVDTFMNTFAFLSFCFVFAFRISRKKLYLILSALFFGLAISSKISAIFILPLIIFSIFNFKRNEVKRSLIAFLLDFLIFGIISFVVLKISDPYMFSSFNFFDPRPNPLFIGNLKELEGLTSINSTYPPMVQWIHKAPLIFPLQNLIIFGVGIPAFILFAIGFIMSLRTTAKFLFLGLSLWMLTYFLYQGAKTTTTMRYFIILYPFIAIFAGLGLSWIYKKFDLKFFALILAAVSTWTLLFFSIYTKPETRVTASYWIYQNIPSESVLLSEHWDDALPVGGLEPVNYQHLEMPVFNPDTKDKWDKMNSLLQKGDYIVLSSNRGWGSIPTVPERYPRMTKFYKDLFAGKLAYKKVAEFTSYPSLSYLGIPLTIPDDSAEEAFTVYDHPKVMIFKKM